MKLSSLIIIFLGFVIWAAAFSPLHARIAPPEPPRPHSNPHQGGHRGEFSIEKGKLLVASTKINEGVFKSTVILLVDYGVHGSLGLIINRPSKIKLKDALPDAGLPADAPLYIGGPVEKESIWMLIRSKEPINGCSPVSAAICVSRNPDLLKGAAGDNPYSFRVYAGYAGWAPGQLETELAMGGWRLVEGEAETVFAEEPSGVWEKLMPR